MLFRFLFCLVNFLFLPDECVFIYKMCNIIYNLERTKIKDTEYPLVSRVLHGPCEKIAKLFVMEKDLGEEVTCDVSLSACIINCIYHLVVAIIHMCVW